MPRWAELKAAYRLFHHQGVTYQKIIMPHWQRTRQRCLEPGEYLLIEDTSDLDFSSRQACEGLGRIGNDHGRGLCLHTLLATRVEGWDLHQSPELQVLGIAGQKCWARTEPSYRQSKERWRQRLSRPRESQRWAHALSQMPSRPAGASWIFLADRDADDYEVFQRCGQQQTDFIIRAQYDRRLAAEKDRLFGTVAQEPVLGSFELAVRARPEREPRVAQMEVRARAVVLQGVWRPEGQRPDLPVYVVEAREVDGPADEKPIHWILLTSLPIESWVQARRVVSRYAQRWVIEEFHKALKTGVKVEKSQLETAEGLKALLGVLVVVAVRLVNTKRLARSEPDQRVDVEAFGPELMEILTARFGVPKGGWTHGSLLVAIARLGGFLARRGDGQPGWLTIWRGWQRLMTMAEGVRSLQTASQLLGAKRCG